MDLLDITQTAESLMVSGLAGRDVRIHGFNHCGHLYFDDAAMADIAIHLDGVLDDAGLPVTIKPWAGGWLEQRGANQPRALARRNIQGKAHYRLDTDALSPAGSSPTGNPSAAIASVLICRVSPAPSQG